MYKLSTYFKFFIINNKISIEFLCGLLVVLPIFSQIYIGVNISIVWIILPVAVFTKPRKIKVGYSFFICIVLFLAAIKFSIAGNYSASLRYFTYIAFLTSISALEFEEKKHFMYGLAAGVVINLIFGSIQYIGLIFGFWSGELDVRSWNQTLWHANPPGGFFTSLPRVAGFTNEPAYLGIYVVMCASLFLFFLKNTNHKSIILLCIFFMLLVNSRTAFFSMAWLFAIYAIHLFWMPRLLAITLAAVSMIMVPALLYNKIDFPIDYDQFLIEDISVFTRSVPIIWAFEKNNLNYQDYLIGVDNYQEYTKNVLMSANSYLVFGSQGGFSDPKSLGAALFFDLGIIGVLLYFIFCAYLMRNSVKAILFFSVINVAFFNVYAFSWPFYWFCIELCLSGVDYHGISTSGRKLTRQADNSLL